MSSITETNWPEVRGRILATIENEENRRVVFTYLEERHVNACKPSTLAHEANVLRNLCESLGKKRLEDATREDIRGHATRTTRTRTWRTMRGDGSEAVTQRMVSLSPSTRAVHNGIIKIFYQWLRGTEQPPPEVAWLSTRRPTKDAIPTDQLIGPREIKALLQAHPNPQDKAILACLYEGGLRAGELCALNIGNIRFDEYGCVVLLPKKAVALKTGARRVRLFEATTYLQSWYELHPRKNDADASLFYSRSHRCPHVRYSGGALYNFCVNAGKRASLRIHTNPHVFRHSAATEKARLGWNEHQLRAFFGWSPNSTMPTVYVHLAGKDYEEMELRRRGLLREGQTTASMAGITCPTCGAHNAFTTHFCQQCRQPIAPEAETAIQEQQTDSLKEKLRDLLRDELGWRSLD